MVPCHVCNCISTRACFPHWALTPTFMSLCMSSPLPSMPPALALVPINSTEFSSCKNSAQRACGEKPLLGRPPHGSTRSRAWEGTAHMGRWLVCANTKWEPMQGGVRAWLIEAFEQDYYCVVPTARYVTSSLFTQGCRFPEKRKEPFMPLGLPLPHSQLTYHHRQHM